MYIHIYIYLSLKSCCLLGLLFVKGICYKCFYITAVVVVFTNVFVCYSVSVS